MIAGVLAMKNMKHTLWILVTFAFAASNALAEESTVEGTIKSELRLFDPQVFGKTPAEPVKLLLPGAELIQPRHIQVDLQSGHYFAATVTYDKVDFEIARRSLNKRYKEYELEDFANGRELALWRNTKDEFAIQLSSFDDEEELRIIYIKFQPKSTVFENMKKAGISICPELEDVSAPSTPEKPEPSDAPQPRNEAF